MAERVRLKCLINDARDKCSIEIWENDKPIAHAMAEIPEFEAIIQDFAKTRAMMSDPVPETLDHGSRLRAIPNPAWRTSSDAGFVLLALRHPGIGWEGFALHPDRARELASSLREIADQLEK